MDEDGSARYADIIASSKGGQHACIVDPTVCFETNDPEQALKIEAEKSKIYEKCVNYYKEKYKD